MLGGIIAVPEREKYVNLLVNELNIKNFREIKVFYDVKKQGQPFNLKRCMNEMLNKANKNEPVLIMTDDVTCSERWLEEWEKIHSIENNNIYTLFTRQRHLLKKEIINKGYITTVQKRGFYDQASIYINQHNLIDKIEKWLEETGQFLPSVKNRMKHYDVIIQEYLIYNNIKWTITVPTLFDHRQIKSSLGHKVGSSILFIDNKEEICKFKE